MNARIRTLAPVLAAFALSGCLLAEKTGPVTLLAPEAAVAADPQWPRADWSLQIERPRSDTARDSARLLVRRSASQLQAYPGVAWYQPVPDLVQATLLRAFEDSGHITAVSRSGEQRSRYRLFTEVRRFEAVDEGGGQAVEIELHLKLVLSRSGQVLDAVTVQRRLPASEALPALTAAFEQALSAVAAEAVGWVLATGERELGDPDPAQGRSG